ncbi:MAG: class I SAM-dependent methyltransferase [Bacteroidetes bacterium]|nr:class I SAM-dependent methyltransferase [Bacteroidota bacterium]
MKSSEEIKEFYDNDTRRKYKIRNNLRHFLIINRLISLGLKRDSRVLEIGCGNGGITKLIAKKAYRGKVTGVDISTECIAAAKSNLNDYKNINYVVSDMLDFVSKEKFDIIVLADVLEHIPIDFHDKLFGTLSSVLEKNGLIFIHIPEPKALEWTIEKEPEKLQVVDQPLHSDKLINTAYKNGLYLRELKSYSIFNEQPDYQYIVLAKKENKLQYKNLPNWKIILKKGYSKLINKLS